MRIKDTYKIRQIAGESILIVHDNPIADMTRIILLNTTSCRMWENIWGRDFTASNLVDFLKDNYEVEFEVAEKDVNNWIATLMQYRVIEQ